ncbi:MAG: hypothetical protein JW801_09845 [Bacteroidales bacterium]|nr:hypothetical protein [Bacteroidales bacterium]
MKNAKRTVLKMNNELFANQELSYNDMLAVRGGEKGKDDQGGEASDGLT